MGVPLGSSCRDRITGFKGIATARIERLYGCPQIEIEPQTTDDQGKRFGAEGFDEARIESSPDASGIGFRE